MTTHERNEVVKSNMGLVAWIAQNFASTTNTSMPVEDLIQEGTIGLMKAVEVHGERRLDNFGSYAAQCIRFRIWDVSDEKGRTVRVPNSEIRERRRVARSESELYSKLGREPTTEELSSATGFSVAKIARMDTRHERVVSFDEPIRGDDRRTYSNFLPDPKPSPLDQLVDCDLATKVRSLLDDLPPIEADVVRKRFGLDAEKEATLEEISDELSISRSSTNRYRNAALQKMRVALEAQAL